MQSKTETLVSALILIAEDITDKPNGELFAPTLHEAAMRLSGLDCALRDAISTYHGPDKLVTAERIEAWQEALTKSYHA